MIVGATWAGTPLRAAEHFWLRPAPLPQQPWPGRSPLLYRSSTLTFIFTIRPARKARRFQRHRIHLIVGVIGCLDPTKAEFREYLDRYHRNKLFLGIRYGNVWEGHNLVAAVESPGFIDNMKAFAQTGLTLEVANPRLDLIDATVRLTDKVPDLRVVLGHLQALPLPTAPELLRNCSNNLRELRKRNLYAKISGLWNTTTLARRPANGQAEFDPAVYNPILDFIWDIFGEDYIVYAGRSKSALEILHSYFMAKGRAAAEKFFWKNSVPAYKWIRRDSKQPQLS